MKEKFTEKGLSVDTNDRQHSKTDLPFIDQKMLFNIFMQVPAILAVLTGRDFMLQLVNEPFELLCGKTDKELIGKRLEDVLPPHGGFDILKVLDTVYETGETYTGKEKKVIVVNEKFENYTYYFDVNCQLYYNEQIDDKRIFLFVYNVTEKVLSRKRFNFTEKKFTDIFYKLPNPMYTCHEDGSIHLYNEAFVSFFGRKPQQYDRWSLAKQVFTKKCVLIPECDWPFKLLFHKDQGEKCELIFELESGEKRNVISYTERITQGELKSVYPLSSINVIVDITEQVQSRLVLEKTARIIKNLYTQAPVLIGTVTGEDFVITLVNPELQKFFGRRQLENQRVEEALPELKSQGVLKTLKSVYNTGKAMVGTEQLLFISPGKNQKARPKYINYSCQPIYEAENQVTGILIFGYDVTKLVLERKKNSENIKKIMETLPQITSISSSTGTKIYFNRFFYKYSGISKKEASVAGWNSILHPSMAKSIIKEWENCREEKKSFCREIRLKRKSDGMYRWHIAQLKPVKNAIGEVINWVASAVDIHEQKVKEERKDEFISIASHELKTPLTTVSAYLQLINECLDDKDVQMKTYAGKALGSVKRLNDLISELLDVSKLQQDKFTLNLTTFNLDVLLKSAMENAQYQYNHKIFLFGDQPGEIVADEERILQVVNNLLSNANKYSPGKEEIHIIVQNQKGGTVVCVKDFGIGISADHREKVFERYFRVSEKERYYEGLGIGLFISMQIIQRHNGSMWVTSEPGQGSSFYFFLPNNKKMP